MGCKLFFISDGEINGSFKRNEDASSSGPNRVNIPLTSLNAPKARSIARAAVKALEKKKRFTFAENIFGWTELHRECIAVPTAVSSPTSGFVAATWERKHTA